MVNIEKPRMHFHDELQEDLTYAGFINDAIIKKWFDDSYSTSKHLLTLYSIVIGLNAKHVLEIGFGRSSFVLARSVYETKGRFVTCDIRDFSYLLNPSENRIVDFVHGRSDKVWEKFRNTGIDFAFLDYFSDESLTKSFVANEIEKCKSLLKTNGIIAIHDVTNSKYKLKSVFESLKSTSSIFRRRDVELITLPYNYGLGLIKMKGRSMFGCLEDIHLKK